MMGFSVLFLFIEVEMKGGFVFLLIELSFGINGLVCVYDYL